MAKEIPIIMSDGAYVRMAALTSLMREQTDVATILRALGLVEEILPLIDEEGCLRLVRPGSGQVDEYQFDNLKPKPRYRVKQGYRLAF